MGASAITSPVDARPQSTRSPGRDSLVLGLLFLFALGLRLWGLGAQSLWLDEGYTANLISRGYRQIAFIALRDHHLPVYYWLLKLWCTRLGNSSDVVLRLPSVFLGSLMVVYASLLSRRFSSLWPVVGVLLALNPFLVRYSQEVRMYALLGCSSVAFFYSSLALEAGPILRRWYHWRYLGWGALCVLSHFMGILWFLFSLPPLLLYHRRRRTLRLWGG